MSVNNPMKDAFEGLLNSIKELVSSDTIIGEPIEMPDGIRIVPISRAVFGFASGGTELDSKKSESGKNYAGGSGAGLTVTPVGFLIHKDGNVQFIQIGDNVTSVERTIAQVPDIVEKLADVFKKD